MYCDAATVAYRRQGIDPATGKHYKPYFFGRYKSDENLFMLYSQVPYGSEALLLPCGKCMLCTRRYRLHWVLRCVHELHYYDEACYLTLTVDDSHINIVFPPLGRAFTSSFVWNSLSHVPFQRFMKRLRRRLDYGVSSDLIVSGKPLKHIYHGEVGKPLRFYMCGEYGDKSHRPHYHAIVFGFYPPDALPLHGTKLFVSPFLSQVWPFGFHTVARVEPDCISYVAGYVDKKMDNSRMEWASNNVSPEYTCMSRGCKEIGTAGLGSKFACDFVDDIWPENDDGTFARDYCIIGKNSRVRTPRYYDKLLSLRLPEKYARLLAFREEVAVSRGASFSLADWLNESHRRNAVAVARRRQRDPGVSMPS